MYNKKEWVSKEVITKEALNNIENGIADLDERLEELESKEVEVDLSGYQEKTDNNLVTESKDIVGAINELFQNANNGKELIASAIGEPLNAEDTFSAMSNDINGLLSTFKTNMMNNGVAVESSDRFKSLIDKIATIADNEGKGIQYVEGGPIKRTNNAQSFTHFSGGTINLLYTDITNLTFTPTILIVTSIDKTDVLNVFLYNDPYLGSQIVKVVNGGNIYILKADSSVFRDNNAIRIPVPDTYGQMSFKWTAIGVGEEDTTLRDSLASILEEEGVEVSEEDDMASLITKVNEEFDNKNANSGGLDIISATELPTTGKENQICVITDVPFDSVIISTKNDEIYNEPNKIILYSVDPRYSIKNTTFNATINNFTYDFHISKIKQGNVNKESYYYRNNIWNELSYTSLPIVKDGAYTNHLGTFKHATNVAGISSDGSGFWLYQGSSTMGSYGLCTSNNTKINFSEYTQIKINLKMNTANKSRTIQFGACSVANAYYNGSNDNTCRTTVGSVEYASITIKPTDTEYHEYILDISNITGEYYIYAHIPQASDTTQIYYYFKDIEFI